MNRYLVGLALALLFAPSDSLSAQARARVDVRGGRLGVGVEIGRLPVRVSPHGPTALGWIAADWGPVRIRIGSRLPVRAQGTLERWDLRYLLGKETVKDIERHARRMGIHGRTRGHWHQARGNTTILEVTVDRIPVAELYDYRNDGVIDELFLIGPPQYHRDGRWRYPR